MSDRSDELVAKLNAIEWCSSTAAPKGKVLFHPDDLQTFNEFLDYIGDSYAELEKIRETRKWLDGMIREETPDAMGALKNIARSENSRRQRA